MNGKLILEGNQREVAQYISGRDGVSHSEIMEGTGIAGSSVSRATNKLEENGVVKDANNLPNKTNYVIVDGVDIQTEMEAGSFFSKTTISQLLGITALVFYTVIIGDATNRVDIFFAGMTTILPTMMYTFYRSLDEKVYAVDRT